MVSGQTFMYFQCMRANAETALLALAARHYGLFTSEDLRRLEFDRGTVAHRLRTGRWEHVHEGVFRVVGAPVTYRQRLLAAVWFNGADAVASHRAAAALWDLPGFKRDPIVEVTKPRGRSQRKEYGWVHGSLVLPAPHVALRLVIPVTRPARTIFDLAGLVHPKRAERALDNALAMGLTTIDELHAVFFDLARRGRAGTRVMRQLLSVRGDRYIAPASALEALGREVFRGGGLPEPLIERNLGDDEDWIGRVDFLYPAAKLVIELDSDRHHSSLLDRQSDLRRDNRFAARGWRVQRYTWWDLTNHPAEVVRLVAQALKAGAA